MNTLNKIFIAFALLAVMHVQAQVGIGTTSPNSAAILEISSTTKGFLPPRMTASQRNAISSPVAGLEIWCTDCGTYGETQIYNGNSWTNILGGASSGVITAGTSTTGGSNPVVIGAGTATGSAQLELVSTSKGFLPPRMTYNQRNAISVSASTAGLQVFCTNCSSAGQMQVYNGSAWTNMMGGIASDTFICGSNITFTYRGSSVTYGTVSKTYGGDTKCWLDRNLGATQVATSSSDAASYGHYFQWGRGDDGHQLLNSTISGTKIVFGTTSSNFIWMNGSSNNDWLTTTRDDLWQGTGGINNPCPSIFRVPTKTELTNEIATWTSGGFSSTLKFPATGFRMANYSTYVTNGVGSNTPLWSSTVTTSGSSWDWDGSVWYENYYRNQGLVVRCIKD